MPGTSRPPSVRDITLAINGDPGEPIGYLESTGTTAPVNNVTTATPFAQGRLDVSVAGGRALDGSLAGRVLLLQAVAAGLILTSASASMVGPNKTVALQGTIPPAAGTVPGVLLQATERVLLIMHPLRGWLQWVGNAGAADLIVWEIG